MTKLQKIVSTVIILNNIFSNVLLLVEYAMRAPSFEPSSEHSMRAWRTKAAAPYYPVPTALELLLEDADVIQSMRLGLS